MRKVLPFYFALFTAVFAQAGLAQQAAPPAASAPAAPATPAPQPCAAPEHRAFDFWVGYWDVYPTAGGAMVAHSLIERRYAGCAIRENWLPLQGEGGGSFSAYRAEDRLWRQTWVDSSGYWVEFTGNATPNGMVLSGLWRGISGPGSQALVRMTYTREANGAVRQLGEGTTDDGRTWTTAWDYTYRPSTSQPPAQAGAPRQR